MTGPDAASTPPPMVSVAVPDRGLRQHLLDVLARGHLAAEEVAETGSLSEVIAGSRADLVLVARSQLAPETAERLTDELDDEAPAIVVVTDESDPADRARLLAAGVTDVLELRQDANDGPAVSARQVAKLETLAEVTSPAGMRVPESGGTAADPTLADFLSRSPRMREFLDVVNRIVDADAALLITGETGVGKERLARAIHAESPRASELFVSVNCGALPEALLESELFGHEKGAFTGADQKRKGHFELAHRGTIFLDEIGDMPTHLQVKLLTVLQRREVVRLGATRPIQVDVRVMAATNRDLLKEIEAGNFREDLYYRLNVIPLEVPSLSERREDIPDLVGHFIRHFREKVPGSEVRGITDAAVEAMLRYHWPGNVRELINVIERAVLLSRSAEITLDDLPSTVEAGADAVATGVGSRPENWLGRPLREVREEAAREVEHAYLDALLRETRGRIGETAKRAGLHPRSLYDKMKRHGLRKENYRD